MLIFFIIGYKRVVSIGLSYWKDILCIKDVGFDFLGEYSEKCVKAKKRNLKTQNDFDNEKRKEQGKEPGDGKL